MDILNLQEKGYEVKKRTDYHYSIFKGNERIDFYPKNKKYHIVRTNERGVTDMAGIEKLFDKIVDCKYTKERNAVLKFLKSDMLVPDIRKLMNRFDITDSDLT